MIRHARITADAALGTLSGMRNAVDRSTTLVEGRRVVAWSGRAAAPSARHGCARKRTRHPPRLKSRYPERYPEGPQPLPSLHDSACFQARPEGFEPPTSGLENLLASERSHRLGCSGGAIRRG